MKLRIYSTLFLVVAVLLSACKTDEYEVEIDDTGDIKVKIYDLSGNAMANQKVEFSSLYGQPLAIETTDENGEIDFGRFVAGDYMVSFEYKIKDYQFATVQEYVQVVRGDQQEYGIQTGDAYEGQLELNVYDANFGTSVPVEGAKIYVVQRNHETQVGLYKALNEDILKMGTFIGTTDAKGKIPTASLPVFEGGYFVYAFNDAEDSQSSLSFNISRYSTYSTYLGVTWVPSLAPGIVN